MSAIAHARDSAHGRIASRDVQNQLSPSSTQHVGEGDNWFWEAMWASAMRLVGQNA